MWTCCLMAVHNYVVSRLQRASQHLLLDSQKGHFVFCTEVKHTVCGLPSTFKLDAPRLWWVERSWQQSNRPRTYFFLLCSTMGFERCMKRAGSRQLCARLSRWSPPFGWSNADSFGRTQTHGYFLHRRTVGEVPFTGQPKGYFCDTYHCIGTFC